MLFVTKKFPFSGVKEATEWMFLYLPNDFPPTVRQIKDRGGSPFNAQAPPLFYLLFVLSIGQKRSAPTPSSDQRQRDQQYKRRGSQSGGAAAAAAAARWRGSGGFPHVGDRYFSRGEKFVEIADTEGERPRRIFCGEGDETGAVFFRDDDIGLSRKAQRR